ncbi:MAG TPA: hypothetical protein VEB66_18010 [Opitutaceae bacterium]|nr:hypothetical protein [Opitutaceae bacterium]
MTIVLDLDLVTRLRLVVDELGARELPLDVVCRALLVEATEERERQLRARVSAHPTCRSESQG